MKTFRRLTIFFLFAGAPLLSGCGFTPLYAVDNGDGEHGGALRRVNLAGVSAAGDRLEPVIERAFERRMAPSGDTSAKYDLYLRVKDRAQRLAVQIDSSVTRYNYRIRANYVLAPRDGGQPIEGSAESIVSFNIVSSQYSTLFAENAAREKAARTLVEQVERDILLKFASANAVEKTEFPDMEDPILPDLEDDDLP